ncbi:hypothetical protein, partial [Ferrimicrobium acidiphilum]
ALLQKASQVVGVVPLWPHSDRVPLRIAELYHNLPIPVNNHSNTNCEKLPGIQEFQSLAAFSVTPTVSIMMIDMHSVPGSYSCVDPKVKVSQTKQVIQEETSQISGLSWP